MKPFDSKGEYTPDEVKAALAGVDGTRPLSFRYERLDRNDTFIENLDYVQACSIENNSLADIKRTAKFDILDTGRMNYLQDRIKPYVRLEMPTTVGYNDYVKSLDPLMWLKMDDINPRLPGAVGTANINNDKTCATRATAYNVSAPYRSKVTVSMQMDSATLRSEFWARYPITYNYAMFMKITNNSNPSVPLDMEIYKAATSTADLELVSSFTLSGPGSNWREAVPFPRPGYYYYVRLVSTSAASIASATITMDLTSRIEDSSGNRIALVADSLLQLEGPGVVNNSGYSVNHPAGSQATFGSDQVDDLNLRSSGPYSLNFWDRNSSKTFSSSEFTIGLDRGYIDFTKFTQSDGTSSVNLTVAFTDGGIPDFYESLVLPVDVYTPGNGHMTSVVIDPMGIIEIYVDATKVATFANSGSGLKEYLPVLQGVISSVYWYGYSDSTVLYTDEVTLFRKVLTHAEVSDIYSKSLNWQSSRSGYVEWPQGVFVLSSPKRTMVDGTYVHRDVEGYDKLVTLKEDSFDYRYAVASGTKYTDAVRRVLQTSASREKYPFSDLTMWSGTVSTVAVTANDRVEMTATSSTDAAGMKTNESSLVMDSLDVSAKMTVPTGNDYTIIQVNVAIDTGTESLQIQVDNANYFKATKGSTILTYLTYNPATMVYWRIRESVGTIYWEYSADGVAWTSLWSMVSPYSPDATIRVAFISSTVNATAVADKVSVVGTRALKHAITKSTSTLPTAMDWEVGTPKLQIINDLLAAINYESASYNEEGVFVARPYISPDKRTSQYTYATDQYSVLHGDVDQTIDIFKIPNKFICVVSDPERPALVGTYTNNNPLSPTSTVSRGRTIVDYRAEQSAPDQATLDGLAARLAFEASQVYEVIEFETGVMPIHQNADVYTVTIDGMVINDKYSEHKWSMDLEVGGSMKHTVRRVVSL